jgi:hypothetical protein
MNLQLKEGGTYETVKTGNFSVSYDAGHFCSVLPDQQRCSG